MVILFTISSPGFNSTGPTVSSAVAAEVDRFASGAFFSRNCSFLSASCSRSVVLCVSKCFGGMAESFDSKKRYSTSAAALAAASAAENGSGCSLNFLDFRTEEDLLSGIKKAAQNGRLSLNMAQAMEELYRNYRDAVCKSGHPESRDVALSNTAIALDRIYMDVKDPYEFSPYHKAIREPFDYYLFGQKYIRPLIDFKHSYVGNISLFHEIEEKLKKGENIVFMSNHQSEADPAVIALLLESTNHHLSENMTYVAGDRVITDPLCKPFSMGRNLICVYSKKHINDDPELIEMKKRANTRSLKEMAMLLRSGSQLIWIAPSGGRDRPDPVTQEWYPAQFDAAAVDNMRRLVEYAGVPGHIYPLALLCYDIMPPPPKVEKDIGEKRIISFNGVGLSVGRKIKFHEVTSSFEDAEEAKMAYSKAVYDSVSYQYNVLKSAIYEKRGIGASTPSVSLSQPFQLAN